MKTTFILIFIVFNTLSGQNTNTFSGWGGFGFGLSSINQTFNHGSMQYNIGMNYNRFSLKLNWNGNYEVNVLFPLHRDPPEALQSQSIELGYSFILWQSMFNNDGENNSQILLNLYSGISRYNGVMRGSKLPSINFEEVFDYEKIEKSGFGTPAEIELEYQPGGYFGITTGLYSNINDFKNFYAIQIGFKFFIYTAP
jgi:hypothetical protein